MVTFLSSIPAIVLSNVLSVLQIRRFGKNYVYNVYVTDFNQVYVYKTYLFCSTKSSFKSTFVCKLIQGRLLGDRGKEKGLFVGHDRSKTFFLKEISISTSPLHLPRIYFDLHRTLCESPEI